MSSDSSTQGSVTEAEIRLWCKEIENGRLHTFFTDHVDENADLTAIRDPDGPMGKTTWIAGQL